MGAPRGNSFSFAPLGAGSNRPACRQAMPITPPGTRLSSWPRCGETQFIFTAMDPVCFHFLKHGRRFSGKAVVDASQLTDYSSAVRPATITNTSHQRSLWNQL